MLVKYLWKDAGKHRLKSKQGRLTYVRNKMADFGGKAPLSWAYEFESVVKKVKRKE